MRWEKYRFCSRNQRGGRVVYLVIPTLTLLILIPWTAHASESAAKSARKCRRADAPFVLSDVDLPLCSQVTAKAAIGAKAAPTGGRAPASHPARVLRIRRIGFSDYMRANANHPALTTKLKDRQQAFVEPVRRAVNSDATADRPGTSQGETPAAQSPSSSGNP